MSEFRLPRLLTFARKLQNASTFLDLLDVVRDETQSVVGYDHVWFMLADTEEAEELRLIETSSSKRADFWEFAPRLKVKGDKFLEEMVQSDSPVVIVDARTDPRTDKAIVERLQNRTIINIPLRLIDKPLGFFGMGTFGDEGCREPSSSDLEYLVGMASQITVAASRIRYLQAQAQAEHERHELERKLLNTQKLESLGMLAGGIAHDFNNLLTVILASASIAAHETQAESVRLEVQSVLDAARRAQELTQKLLAMSRAQDLDLKLVDLNVQLTQLSQLARRVLPETITLDLIQGASLPLIEADPSQIDQVFMNLFINARDAMTSGGELSVETELVLVNGKYVETHPWAKAGRYVLVTVTDTGTGMSREVQDRIFEPFFTTKGDRAGTGLGLAIVYGIVRQHRGMIHCYSELGVGTSFKVYFPVAERLAATIGTKLERPALKGNERILVAEDDDMVRSVAVRILERAGYRITAVVDGEAACQAVAKQQFDLVLLDVVMPGMAVQDTVERIRSLSPGLRILLTSGYAAGANVASFINHADLELLRKPYDPDQMLRMIRAHLER